MASNYYIYMGRHLDLTDKRIKEIVDMLGNSTGLGEGLNIAKSLIENYFEGDENSQKIITLIEQLQKKKKGIN
jgi:hypothetical protein